MDSMQGAGGAGRVGDRCGRDGREGARGRGGTGGGRPGPRVARAQGGLVLGGLDEALPRVKFTAWPGWPSPGTRTGPCATLEGRIRSKTIRCCL